MHFDEKQNIIEFQHSHLELLTVCRQNQAAAKLPRTLHQHDDRLELVFVNKGSGTYHINGKQYETTDGDLLIYNSGILHDEHHIIQHYDEGIDIFGLSVTGLKIRGLADNHLIPEEISPKIATKIYQHTIYSLFSLLHEHSGGIKQFNKKIINHILQALIILVTEISKCHVLSSKQKEDRIASEIQNYLDKYYWDDVNLAKLAAELQITSFYLSHAFKKHTGYSPSQYIARRRVGEAQTLLLHSQYNLTQIALSVGFSNVTYFQHVFTKYVGVTPKIYRQTMLDENKKEYVLINPQLLRIVR